MQLARLGTLLASVAVALLSIRIGSTPFTRSLAVMERFTKGPKEEAPRTLHIVDTTFDSGGRKVRGRLYLPANRDRAPGLVMVHGVHRKSIDEPRLTHLATTLASSSLAVFTPEVRELADYRIESRSVQTVRDAASYLAATLSHKGVGVMGMSFGGGLAMLSPLTNRAHGEPVSFAVSVGGHCDLGRVLGFFVGGKAHNPDGSQLSLSPHPYGILVLAFKHITDLFPAADRANAEAAIRMWLAEEREHAGEYVVKMTPSSQTRFSVLTKGELGEMRAMFEAFLQADEPFYRDVSPCAFGDEIDVPIFALHGAGDNVIPPSESRWVGKTLPTARDVVISNALQHVELSHTPSLVEQTGLVQWMGNVIDETELEP